jgi:translation elongation factor EF-Tu-like GTPase
MAKKTVRVGIVGHVDHGKTTLSAAVLAASKVGGIHEVEGDFTEPVEVGTNVEHVKEYVITNPYKDLEMRPLTRKERREQERKSKKK